MLDHMGFRVRDLGASRRFYEAAMGALGLTVIDDTDSSFLVGRSTEPVPFIWIGTDDPEFWTMAHRVSASPIHVALAAKDRQSVDAFYRAALKAGARDNGAPGLRGADTMKYYAAFVLDPDGNNIEACVRA